MILTNKPVPSEYIRALEHGLKYCPRSSPNVVQALGDIHTAAKVKREGAKIDWRLITDTVIKSVTATYSQTVEDIDKLSDYCTALDLVVCRADKGGAVIVVDRSVLDEKLKKEIVNESAERLNGDPT